MESLLTLAVLSIMFGIGTHAYVVAQRSFSRGLQKDVGYLVRQAARGARVNKHDAPQGVLFPYDEASRTTDQVIFFTGESYLARDPALDLVVNFDRRVRFEQVVFSGAAASNGNDHEIVFTPYAGKTLQYGTITTHFFNQTSVLTVTKEGFVN